MTGKEAKYVVLKERNPIHGGREENIYPFSSHIIHKDFVRKFGELAHNRVVGAGFIRFNEDGVQCYGESVSLRVKSREEDSMLARLAFGRDF